MRFWLSCLDDVHQILFSTLANLMLDNLWTKTFFVLLLWICAYETKGVTASSLGTTSRTFYLFVLLLRSGKFLRWWQECLLLLRRNPMLDRIWQDHFLTVKMVKQLWRKATHIKFLTSCSSSLSVISSRNNICPTDIFFKLFSYTACISHWYIYIFTEKSHFVGLP